MRSAALTTTPDRTRRNHIARVLGSPVKGVYSTHIDSDCRFQRHWHDGYGFGFLEHGAQTWWSGRGQVRGDPGDVISTNPGEVHDGRPIGSPRRRWRIVYTDADAMSAITGSRRGDAHIVRPVIRDPALTESLDRLFVRIERWNARPGDRADALAFEEALVDSCVQLMSRHGTVLPATNCPTHDLQRVRDRLADDVCDVPSLAEMAAMTGLSRFQVLRRFERAFGLPPHAFVLQCRAERARLLIRDGRTLATAAAECGFVDQSHLTRVFTRQFGFTPGAWRRASRLQ